MQREGYLMRAVRADDAGIVAAHRAAMFLDMGEVSAEGYVELLETSAPWLAGLLSDGAYVGKLIEHGNAIVAGGGIWLRELGPTPACPRVGKWAHLVNVYTVPEHRRHGLARWLVTELLNWCEENQMDHVTLGASDDGRPLYESLGFVATVDMRLQKRGHAT